MSPVADARLFLRWRIAGQQEKGTSWLARGSKLSRRSKQNSFVVQNTTV